MSDEIRPADIESFLSEALADIDHLHTEHGAWWQSYREPGEPARYGGTHQYDLYSSTREILAALTEAWELLDKLHGAATVLRPQVQAALNTPPEDQ